MPARITGIDKCDALLLIGTNPRYEAPILNARIRKAFLADSLDVALLGERVALTYEYEHLGDRVDALEQLANRAHPFYAHLAGKKRPMVLIGAECLQRADGDALYRSAGRLAANLSADTHCTADWSVFNVLQRYASQVGAMDVGYRTDARRYFERAKARLIYVVGADQGGLRPEWLRDAFVIYQGHHGDRVAPFADVVLPGAAYAEKTATYVNTEGRAQQTHAAMMPPGAAREDWKIVRALSEFAGVTLPYDTLVQLRERMRVAAPNMTRYDVVETPNNYATRSARQCALNLSFMSLCKLYLYIHLVTYPHVG